MLMPVPCPTGDGSDPKPSPVQIRGSVPPHPNPDPRPRPRRNQYVMLSPRGSRPHDAPSPSSPSPRHAGMDAGACGRVHEWEAGLPSPAELTPLSHPLIPPALAAAFRIDITGGSPTSPLSLRRDDDGGNWNEEEGEGETEDAALGGGLCRRGRVGKKARMVWTPELHQRFIEVVALLGDKGAVPKAIVRTMNVEGLTRDNVASHLQKYRLYLKRTRTTPATPPPPSLRQAYGGSPFNPQPPPGTSSRSGYSAFLSPYREKLERY